MYLCACFRWATKLTGVLDHVTGAVSDHVLEKLESLPETQASDVIAHARAAEARAMGDTAVPPPRVPGVAASRRHKSPAVGSPNTAAVARHASGSVPASRGALPTGSTAHLDGGSGAADKSELSGQRDLGLAVISVSKVAVDAVCKQLSGVHIQRFVQASRTGNPNRAILGG